jgi:hypothetical protein
MGDVMAVVHSVVKDHHIRIVDETNNKGQTTVSPFTPE